MHRRAFLVLGGSVLFAPSTARAFSFGAADWPTLKRTIRERYPEVRQMSTEALRASLARGDSLLLIDARAPQEYQVSHLQGAHNAPTSSQAVKLLSQAPTDQTIVVYCSVGYRSSALVRDLMRLGYKQVANLEGSIFEWANKGFALFRGNDPVSVVHPYDTSWGRLLDRKLWSTERP